MAAEKARFPTSLEIITGQFPRHSKAYYQWRLKDSKKNFRNNKTPQLYDDIAVAQEKLGDTKSALKTMEAKLKKYGPSYETFANLGTFLIHSGKFEEGLKFIGKAVQLNPDAHFGREKYQRWLVQYLLATKAIVNGKIILPTGQSNTPPYSFANFLKKESNTNNKFDLKEQKKAIEGIQGMMRFMSHESPLLLQILGELLSYGHPGQNANRLAAMCYLRAAKFAKGKAVKLKFTKLVQRTILSHDGLKMGNIIKELKIEVKRGDELNTKIESSEKNWIGKGKNASILFDKTFLKKWNERSN